MLRTTRPRTPPDGTNDAPAAVEPRHYRPVCLLQHPARASYRPENGPEVECVVGRGPHSRAPATETRCLPHEGCPTRVERATHATRVAAQRQRHHPRPCATGASGRIVGDPFVFILLFPLDQPFDVHRMVADPLRLDIASGSWAPTTRALGPRSSPGIVARSALRCKVWHRMGADVYELACEGVTPLRQDRPA